MKRVVLLVSVFIALTGFCSNDVKVFDVDPIVVTVKANDLPPRIEKVDPKNREVEAAQGATIKFGIKFGSTLPVSPSVLKDGNFSSRCQLSINRDEVYVVIKDVKVTDSGKYMLSVQNEAGISSAIFHVIITK